MNARYWAVASCCSRTNRAKNSPVLAGCGSPVSRTCSWPRCSRESERMNVYLSLIKREFQEHSGLFVWLPAAVTAGLILIMLYTAWKFPPNSALFEFGLIELVVNEEPDAEADTVKRQGLQ